MSVPTDVLLLRHGQTDWNLTHRIQGSVDIALNERGLAQARAASTALADAQLTAVISSPLERALVTAQLVNARHGHAISTDSRLAERAHGRFEGWTVQEIIAEIGPDDVDDFFQHSPELESWDDVSRRVIDALHMAATTHPEGTTLVVSHGGAIKAAIAGIRNVHHRSLPSLFNCSLTRLRFDGSWNVVEYNNVDHLPDELRS